jgi:hypothetical protein
VDVDCLMGLAYHLAVELVQGIGWSLVSMHSLLYALHKLLEVAWAASHWESQLEMCRCAVLAVEDRFDSSLKQPISL